MRNIMRKQFLIFSALALSACADARYGAPISGRNQSADLFACRYQANYERNKRVAPFGALGAIGTVAAGAGQPSVADANRQARPGNISRNTWITEAIEEKLARDRLGGLKGSSSDHA